MGEDSVVVFANHHRIRHLMSNSTFWADLMNMRSGAEKGFSAELQKMVDKIDQHLQSEFDEVDEECRHELEVYRSAIINQLGMSKDDGELYDHCVKEIEGLGKKGEAAVLEFYKTKFRNLMNEYQMQKTLIDLRREKYLRRCAAVEVEEVKQMFSEEKAKLQAQLDSMKTQTDKSTRKYERSLAGAVKIIEEIKKASTKYEKAWRNMEQKNCEALMAIVTKSVEDSHAWRFFTRDIGFSHVDVPALLEENIVRLRIDTPKFQKYEQAEDKKELLSSLLRDGLITIDAAHARRKKAVVLENYKKTGPHEISLKKGGKLKQILPANADGFAYGIFKKGKFRKARKGFYPAANVRVLEKD